MKKIIILTLALAFGFGGLGASEAEAKTKRGAPLWACQMSFSGKASGLKVILGKYSFRGRGTLNCTDAIGHRVSYPINLVMKAHFLVPGVAIGSYRLNGQALNISLFNTDPEALFGKYTVVHGHAAIIGGAGVITAVKVGAPHLSLKVAVNFARGFGLDLALSQLTISPVHDERDDHDDVVPN